MTKYNKVIANQPYIVGANALNINIHNVYSMILENYNHTQEEMEHETNGLLTTKEVILTIQKSYLELAEYENINISGTNIMFSENFWDFSEHYKDGKDIGLYRFYINAKTLKYNMSEYYKVVLKLFLFYLITENGIQYSSNKKKFTCAREFLSYLTNKDIEGVEDLTLDELKEYIDNRDVIYTTIVKIKRAIKEFYILYSLLSIDVYTREFADYFNDIDINLIKSINQINKTKLLPTKFYNTYAKLLYNLVMDTTREKKDRCVAGLLYIGTQTGLRGAELTILKDDCLEIMKYKGKKAGILHYRATKNGGNVKVYKNAETNASSKVIEVIEIIKHLIKKEKKESKSELLYINPKSSVSYTEGITETSLQRYNQKFCIENYKELGILNTSEDNMFEGSMNMKAIKRKFKGLYLKKGFKADDILSVPTIVQFRVYFSSELRERGIDDRTISYLLNHDTPEMWGYYVRPKNEIQEDIDFSREIIGNILTDDTKILGQKGEAFRKKIEDFIANNHFNIVRDLDAIIDKVCNEIPIRAKEGGFCAKSNPRRECRHDSKTDEFFCAYGCCPNHFHFYFMVSITYSKYLDIVKLVKYNENNGYINQSQKELYKLEAVINQELLPELIELQSQLIKNGKEVILEKHPKIQYIISNNNTIMEDIKFWKKKIKALKI